MSDFRIIALCGAATSGKDYFAKYLINKFPGMMVRHALADELKADLNDFLKQKFGISAFTIDSGEKTLIRDILVAYGKVKRLQTQGKYWTNLLQPKINRTLQEGKIPIVTDIRYDVFPEDEVFWALNQNKGVLIHLSRRDKSGNIIAPPNADEKENDPKLQAKANYALVCPTFLDSPSPEKQADFFYSNNLETVMRELSRRYELYKMSNPQM